MQPGAPPINYHPIVSSWMFKRAEWRFAWDRRLVSLQGSVMSYKEGPNLPDKKAGLITSFQRECSTPLTFRVWVEGDEVWTLRAEDADSYGMWVHAIMRVVMKGSDTPPRVKNEASAATSALTLEKGGMQTSVMKRSYWTHSWRPRVLMLPPTGCVIEYSVAEGGPVRGRITVRSIDPVAPEQDDGRGVTEVALQASNDEGFHVRFPSEPEAAAWIVALRERLGEAGGCRWQALQLQKASGSTANFVMSVAVPRGGQGGAATDAALGRVAHCAFVERDHLFVFGGRTSAGFSCTDDLVGHFGAIPSDTSVTSRDIDDDSPPSQLCSKDLFHVRLSGDFIANTTTVQPFEEVGRAKVRPVEREGAGGCLLGGHWCMHGGRTFSSGAGGVLNDAWSIDLADLTSGAGLQWTRRSEEAVVVSSESQVSAPHIAFHTATQISPDTVLLCGGTSDGVTASDATWYFNPLSGSVRRGPSLPSPRLQHAAIAIPSLGQRDGFAASHVIVVGGSTVLPDATHGASSSHAALPLIVMLDVSTEVWSEVRLEYPTDMKLPAFTYPCAALLPSVPDRPGSSLGRLAIFGGSLSSRKLPRLITASIQMTSAEEVSSEDCVDDGTVDFIAGGAAFAQRVQSPRYTALVRPVEALGDSPTYSSGCQMLVYGGYLYLVGGGGPGGVALPRLMLATL